MVMVTKKGSSKSVHLMTCCVRGFVFVLGWRGDKWEGLNDVKFNIQYIDYFCIKEL